MSSSYLYCEVVKEQSCKLWSPEWLRLSFDTIFKEDSLPHVTKSSSGVVWLVPHVLPWNDYWLSTCSTSALLWVCVCFPHFYLKNAFTRKGIIGCVSQEKQVGGGVSRTNVLCYFLHSLSLTCFFIMSCHLASHAANGEHCLRLMTECEQKWCAQITAVRGGSNLYFSLRLQERKMSFIKEGSNLAELCLVFAEEPVLLDLMNCFCAKKHI